MIVRINNVKSQVIPETDHDSRVLKRTVQAFARKMPNYYFSKAHKEHGWDGTVYFVNNDGSFETGLLPPVLKYLKRQNTNKFNVVDHRENTLEFGPIQDEYFGKSITGNRDYQKNAVEKFARLAIGSIPFHRGIIDAATNAGKSLMFSILQAEKLSKGLTVVLIDDSEVYYQLIEGFRDNGFDCGHLRGKDIRIRSVNVWMYQSALNRVKDTEKVREAVLATDFLISDECHTSASPTYRRLVRNFKNAEGRLFVSGTPLEHGDKLKSWNVISHSGPVISKVTNKDLINRGISMETVVNLIKIYTWEAAGDYEDDYRKNVVYNPERAARIREVCSEKGRHTLIAVDFKEHGAFLESIIDDSYFMPGDDLDRKTVYRLFKTGRITTLITTVLRKGVNIPDLNTLILAQGRKSTIDVKQLIGRLLRMNDKDSHVEVYDFMDRGQYVTSHSRKREEIYRKEGFKIKKLA